LVQDGKRLPGLHRKHAEFVESVAMMNFDRVRGPGRDFGKWPSWISGWLSAVITSIIGDYSELLVGEVPPMTVS
jgi:hypothetical protein